MGMTKCDEAGDPLEVEPVALATETLPNQLSWCGAALKKARGEHPYGQPLVLVR